MLTSLLERIKSWRTFLWDAVKWVLAAVIVGVLSGLLGSAFHISVDFVTELRGEHDWIIFTLPAVGLGIVGLYKLLGAQGVGTDSIIEEVNSGRGIKLGLIPSIFISTVATHLAGGSVGREGAALQLGGTIGFETGKLLKLEELDTRVATMAGMAAFFTALFGTPMAATVFAMTVASVGMLYHSALLPCLAASITAYGVSTALGVEPTRFAVAVPEFGAGTVLGVAGLAIICAFVSVLFCEVIHVFEHGAEKYVKNPWVRAAVGGCAVIALTLVSGTRDYNGAGMNIIAAAVEEGRALPWAFIMKLLFTAVTLSAGFKGGEVVPSFFVGATFACVVGPLLGLPAGFAAAVGMVSVFCGAVNCPIASTILAVELFGGEGLIFYALACSLSYVFSGYSGLYSSQLIVYDKLHTYSINAHTNAYKVKDREIEHAEEK